MADVAKMTTLEIARYIDNSFVLDIADDTVPYKTYIEDIKKYKFGAICVLPYHIELLVNEIGDFCKEHDVKIGCPIGFPFGQNFTSVKVFETKEAVRIGATQLDWACNVSAIKEKRYDFYQNELKEFAKIGKDNNVMTKAIIQVQHLTDEELNPLPTEAGRFLLRLKSQFRLKPVAMRLKPAEATAHRRLCGTHHREAYPGVQCNP